ncbi:MAG: hydroxyacylglutathione hydrolase [Litorilituus sp.]|jgi:hydroxyacylglutathione hydrolase|nr:hydroxyacylglutathione hydrolase [Litorilituus sp.]
MQSHIDIKPIHAFSDNYIWAITQFGNQNIVLVDPGDADVCIDYIKKYPCKLCAILVTHHHEDHVGGITKLIKYCQQQQWPITVYGPANETIPYCDVKLSEGDSVSLNEFKINFNIIDLPGHTKGHIAYYGENILFCGDTLFSGGCGRIFEGTPEQMYNSLNKLAQLADNTKVYCAHEYTQANLAFAAVVDNENADLETYQKEVVNKRKNGLSTIPTNIAQEKRINPFFRCDTEVIQRNAQRFSQNTNLSSLETFTAIRRWKDQF